MSPNTVSETSVFPDVCGADVIPQIGAWVNPGSGKERPSRPIFVSLPPASASPHHHTPVVGEQEVSRLKLSSGLCHRLEWALHSFL